MIPHIKYIFMSKVTFSRYLAFHINNTPLINDLISLQSQEKWQRVVPYNLVFKSIAPTNSIKLF